MKPKQGRWYVVAWSDHPPTVALCIRQHFGSFPCDARFYFPNKDGRSRSYLGYSWSTVGTLTLHEIDSYDQLIADLGAVRVPKLPKRLMKFRLKEDV